MIVFINNGWYFPGLSGGDVHVMEVANRWGREREVGIAIPEWAYRLHRDRLENVRLISTGGALDRVPARSLAALCVRYLLRCFRSFGIRGEFVVAGSHYPYDLIPAVVISRVRKRPLAVYVFHLSSTFRTHGLRAWLVARWEQLALKLMSRASLVLVDNTDVQADLASAGITASRIHMTWNAPTSAPADFSAEQRRNDEVVFCGRITETKGWRDLLVVGEKLKDECPGVTLRILGDGDRKKDLEDAVARRDLGGVIRTEGFVPDEVKWRALSRATVFVTPSREEGWGIAVSEALQAGAEVVCYDLPVYHEVHAQNHLHFVPSGDVDGLADRVVAVLRNGSHESESSAITPTHAQRQGSTRTWDDIASHEMDLARSSVDIGPRLGVTR